MSGSLTASEQAALAQSLQWHNLPSTPLHLCEPHIVDGIASLRVSETMPDASPAIANKAHGMVKALMLERSIADAANKVAVEQAAARREHSAKRAASRKHRSV